LQWEDISADRCAKLLVESRVHITSFKNITIVTAGNIPSDALTYYNGMGEMYFAKASDISHCYSRWTKVSGHREKISPS